jgi:aryl-alcohol dehydrogenase-like predicted oxidoreductase
MATSLVDHAGPDDPQMRRAFERGPVGLVASYVLAGGTLTGKYDRGEAGRAETDESPVIARGKRLAAAVNALADEWGVAPAHVAFAYAFQHSSLATVLFGSSSA